MVKFKLGQIAEFFAEFDTAEKLDALYLTCGSADFPTTAPPDRPRKQNSLKLTSCTILNNRQDACSTRKFTLCGTGILPVHKKLIENGARSQTNATNHLY